MGMIASCIFNDLVVNTYNKNDFIYDYVFLIFYSLMNRYKIR